MSAATGVRGSTCSSPTRARSSRTLRMASRPLMVPKRDGNPALRRMLSSTDDVPDQPEVLVDEAAAVRVGRLGGAEGDLGSVDGDPTALVRHVVAGEDLDEGGLPRAVLPQQRVDLTVLDGEIDALEGSHPAEGLGETFSEEGRHVAAVGHPTSQSFLNWSAKSVGLS